MTDIKEFAPTKRSAVKTVFAAFQILNENDNEMPRKALIEEMEKRLEFEDWELERYKSNNQLKWLTIFLFYTVDCIKAGWLVKTKGIWYLTPEGQYALKLGAIGLFKAANKAYRDWKKSTEEEEMEILTEEELQEIEYIQQQFQKVTIDELEAQAKDGIGQYLDAMDEYKFQSVCSVLLKAMGYYIDFEALPGKDGGIDIIAYKDPLGFEKPRLKVQVKRYKADNKIDTDKIRILKGVLHHGEDIGLFITSSYFTRDAEKFARESTTHIRLINREEFIELWQKYYYKLNEEEKAMLPLHPIYFLGSNE